MEYTCKICGNEHNTKTYNLKDIWKKDGEHFDYFQCDNCGCVQIVKIPENLGDYYSNDSYFSFENNKEKHTIKTIIKDKIRRMVLDTKAYRKKAENDSQDIVERMQRFNIEKNQKILDVGCGAGELLNRLRRLGYKKISGVDPFLENDTKTKYNVKLLSKNFIDVNEKYDVIVMKHSFEHVDNPQDYIDHLKVCLNDNGRCFISLPVSDSYSWKEYGENWLGSDAPRHLFLHTEKSIKFLCEKAGMKIAKLFQDEQSYFLRTSELIKRGYIHSELTKKDYDKEFSENDMLNFEKLAKECNENETASIVTFEISVK